MENQQNNQQIIPEATVSGSYGHAWETLKRCFPEMLLIFLIQFLVSLPMGLSGIFFDSALYGVVFPGFFNIVYGVVVLSPVSYGANWVYLKAVRGEQFKASDMFFAFQQIGNVLLSVLLVGLIVGIGIVLLIVPGIIFACKLAFVPYLVMDEKMEAVGAVRKSWQMTAGFTGNIFLMAVAAFFVGLLGFICLIVGIIPAGMWISLAFATIYMAVAGRAKP